MGCCNWVICKHRVIGSIELEFLLWFHIALEFTSMVHDLIIKHGLSPMKHAPTCLGHEQTPLFHHPKLMYLKISHPPTFQFFDLISFHFLCPKEGQHLQIHHVV